MRYICLLNCLCFYFLLWGQSVPDSVVALPVATVQGDRYSLLPIGSRQDTLALNGLSARLTEGMDDVLEREGLLFVRKYGPVGLAAISVRGTSVSQSAVLWNGMNLQSPMNGQKDLRLIPAFFVEDASVSYGAGGALAGSGAIGGTLQMNTRTPGLEGRRMRVQSAFGSYGHSSYGLAIEFGGRQFQSGSKMYLHGADNDYPFTNTTRPGAPGDTLRHARVQQYGFQQHNRFNTALGSIELNVMHLRAQRQLPPTVFENVSQKAQQDATTYANVGWQRNNAKHGWNVELGWINENIDYQDTAIGMYSANKANSFIFQPEYSRAIKGVHLLKMAGYHRTDLARLDAAEGQVLRHESAAITSVALALSPKWMLNANVRLGYSRSQWQPVIPSVATSFSLLDYLTAKLQMGRHYREPTLNDLYWEPGGNPDLQPEDGSSASTTLSYSPKIDNTYLSVSLSGYASYIQHQIVWKPAGAYWSPYNVSEVYSRGAESWIKVGHQRGRWKIRAAAGATYTRASEGNFSNERQVAQIPLWKSINHLSVQWRYLLLRYRHQWTGMRYLNAGNTSALPPFDVATLELSAKHQLPQFTVEAFAKMENVWNSNYRIVSTHFMPPRHFKAGLSISFNKKQENP